MGGGVLCLRRAGRKRSQGWVSRRGARAAAGCLPRRWNLPPAAQALASLFSVSLLLLLNSFLPFWPMLELIFFKGWVVFFFGFFVVFFFYLPP